MSNVKPIIETSYLGAKTAVYEDRLKHKFMLKKISIPIDQVASVDLGTPLYAGIRIETTGGKEYLMPIWIAKKNKVQEAIYRAKNMGTRIHETRGGDLGDLEKLAALKEKGIITQADFEAKKKQILGL